ncbi:MAG: 6-phosphofructokinase [Phycisphaerae bacterium]
MGQKRVGIIVGGGPAPGINAVIGSATIEGINQGFEVVGFYEGFRYLCSDTFSEADHTIKLDIPQVARIHFDGGSMLRISRVNLLDEKSIAPNSPVRCDPAKVGRVVERFQKLGITHLITIGGDDTALSARFVAEGAGGAIRSVHVPKTIDNDLPLPQDSPTFGFSTARYLGTMIVKNLMQDSLTTGRWYLVTVMGRSAGWLALSIGQAASATVTLIPEEFAETTTLSGIADVIEGTMLKRQTMGRPDGVAVVAEGLAYRLGDREKIEELLGHNVPVDAAGHIRLSEIPLGLLLRRELQARYKARGQKVSMVNHVLGYELRSADPTPGDMAYCRSLGHGCIRLLSMNEESHSGGVMVALINGNLFPISFSEMVDPRTNRVRVRTVDIKSDLYRVARSYMLRLERADLDDPGTLSKLAEQAKMTPDQFHKRYLHAATRLVDGVPA